MRAAVMRDRALVVADVRTPEPGAGEVLVRTLVCGICGSDLHALKHADKFVENSRRAGNPRVMDLGRDVIMGHEFCAEIVEHGPKTTGALKVGTRVCSRPVLMRAAGPQSIGYSNDNPGGYGEYMRLSEVLLLEVPNGLSTEHAALTEPMAVGVHAVAKARLEPDDAPLVIGCGPVGLAVIAALRLRGVRPIVAADFSSRRRELAIALGADGDLQPAVVVDGLASVGEDVQDGLLDGRAVDQDRRQGRELLVDRDPAPFDRVPDQVHRLVDERGQIGLRELGWTRAGEVT